MSAPKRVMNGGGAMGVTMDEDLNAVTVTVIFKDSYDAIAYHDELQRQMAELKAGGSATIEFRLAGK